MSAKSTRSKVAHLSFVGRIKQRLSWLEHAGSDDEGEDRYRSLPPSRSHSRKDHEYLKIANETMDMLFELVREGGWITERESQGDMVQSAYIKKLKRKIFKLECTLDISPHELWKDTIDNVNDSPSWNPTLLESKTLLVVDEKTDISYNIAAEAAGGPGVRQRLH